MKHNFFISTFRLFLIALMLSVSVNANSAGSLTGAVSVSTSEVNLATKGTTDWIHFYSTVNRKLSGGSQISNYTKIGTGTVQYYTDDTRPLTWTGGSPTLNSSANRNGIYINSTGNGFSFTVPANSSLSTLYVYVRGNSSTGTLTAHLSDGSASDYTSSSLTSANGNYTGTYVLTFKAASSGQTLTVSWIMSAGTGWVGMSAAALSVPPDTEKPSTPVNLVASNKGAEKFTLTWDVSTDNIGVSKYDVYKDGLLYDSIATNSIDVSGLTPETTYAMTVRARDAAKNVSDLSLPLNVTTTPQDINTNYQPKCGVISTKLYAGKGQQVLILPGIDDGDNQKIQNINITAVSTDLSKMTVDSVSYHAPDKVAFIYVKSTFETGTVGINISLKDDGGTANGGIDSFSSSQTITIIKYSNTCANFIEYDVPQWQPRPTQNTLPTEGSYKKICETNTPIEKSARDFFWMRMNGYIIPSKTDYYIFQGFSNEGFHFFMNLDDGISTDFSKLTTMVEDATSTWNSGSVLLEANKPYYFEAYARDIVNTQPFWLKWTSASIPLGYITTENLAPDYDIVKPAVPSNFIILNKGVNDVTLKWDASKDDNPLGIKGYDIFVDGEKVNSEYVTDTEYKCVGLNPSSFHSFSVVAVDLSFNSSYPSKVINATTFGADATPPPVPTNLTSVYTTSFGVKLKWNSVVDAETQTRGYNIYQNNVLVKENFRDTTVLINDLTERTSYVYTVSSVDANYNESAKSAPYNVTTASFDPNETKDDIYKGRLTVELKPLCKFNGLGLLTSYNRNGILSSNKVTYGNFESSEFYSMNGSNLANYDKAVSNASLTRSNANPYQGAYSAKISAIGGGYLRCNLYIPIDKQNTYLVRFAMRRGAGYSGTVSVSLKGMFAGSVFTPQIVTPTDEWQMFELEYNTTYSGSERSWYLDFTASVPGDLYIDNIQFVNKADYKAGSPFSTKTMDLLKEFKVRNLRWGGIVANSENYKYCSGIGAEKTFSYAEWITAANELNAKAFFSTGISPDCDFVTNPAATYKSFAEYLAGNASTTGGALRIAEGYPDLLSKSKGILVEFGNEVWGSTTHNSAFSDYALYGPYARNASSIMKAVPGYNDSIIKTAYSGRAPGNNYGLHQKMLTGDKGEVDILSISGYLGGTMTYTPDIPLDVSQLDYYKTGFGQIQNNFNGLKNDQKEMLALTGRVLPMYMYEGNMTTSAYNGRVGQAIAFADYYTSMPLYGVPELCVFNLEGGEWRLIEDDLTFAKRPLFYVGKYINTYCTGTMLETKFTTATKIYNKGGALTIDPIGCKAFTDTTSYSVALFSRDFEHDYHIQMDIPDNVGNGATCKLITITGDSYSSTNVTIDEKDITNFKDSMLVKVPKYSMVIVRFDGIDQHYNAPEVYTSIKKAESIKISTVDNNYSINKNGGRLTLNATILPSDAFLTTPSWKLLDNETIAAYTIDGTTSTTLYGNRLATGNGYIRVVAYVNDGSGVADTVKVLVNMQGGVNILNAIENIDSENLQVYPNPVKDYLHVNFNDDFAGTISVVNLNGQIIHSEAIKNREIEIDVQSFKQGVYFVKLNLKNGPKYLKFLKQ